MVNQFFKGEDIYGQYFYLKLKGFLKLILNSYFCPLNSKNNYCNETNPYHRNDYLPDDFR